MIVDHFNKKYFVGDFKILNKLLDTSFNYYSLQNCITNTPLFNIDKHYSFDREENYYSFSFIDEKEIDSLIYLLNISLKNILLEAQKITTNNKVLSILHNDYKPVNDIMFPFKLNVTIGEETGSDKTLELNYLKVKINQTLQFSFSIPKDYEAIY